jgi:hypothetical protein
MKMDFMTHIMKELKENPDRSEELEKIKEASLTQLNRVPSLVTDKVFIHLEKMDKWLRSKAEKDEKGAIASINPGALFATYEGLGILSRIIWELGFCLKLGNDEASLMQVMACATVLEQLPRYHVTARVINGIFIDGRKNEDVWMVFLGKWFEHEMPVVKLDESSVRSFLDSDDEIDEKAINPKWHAFMVEIPEDVVKMEGDWANAICVVNLRRVWRFFPESGEGHETKKIVFGLAPKIGNLTEIMHSLNKRKKARKNLIPLTKEYSFSE